MNRPLSLPSSPPAPSGGREPTELNSARRDAMNLGGPASLPAPGDWPFWEYKMDALLTAEAYSGGAERRKNVAHGVSRGFPGGPHASPGGATENLEQGALLQLCRPCRGLRFIRTSSPRLAPWATVWRRSAAFVNADCPSGTHAPVNGQSPVAGRMPAPLWSRFMGRVAASRVRGASVHCFNSSPFLKNLPLHELLPCEF